MKLQTIHKGIIFFKFGEFIQGFIVTGTFSRCFFFKYVYSMSRTSQNKHMFKTHILICLNWVLNLDYFRYCFLPLFQEGNVGTFILPRKKIATVRYFGNWFVRPNLVHLNAGALGLLPSFRGV